MRGVGRRVKLGTHFGTRGLPPDKTKAADKVLSLVSGLWSGTPPGT